MSPWCDKYYLFISLNNFCVIDDPYYIIDKNDDFEKSGLFKVLSYHSPLRSYKIPSPRLPECGCYLRPRSTVTVLHSITKCLALEKWIFLSNSL
jgi:hypothetical protein